MQINLVTEEEMTKLLRLIAGLYNALKIDIGQDAELKEMLKRDKKQPESEAGAIYRLIEN